MQNPLFDESEPAFSQVLAATPVSIDPMVPEHGLIELAQSLPTRVRLGSSSWNYPGWAGLVWRCNHTEAELARHGLTAYAQYPLFRTVSIDRGFYRSLTAAQFAEYAAQVGPDFRFVVKAPSLVTDAMVRDASGRGKRANRSFLDPVQAVQTFVEPAVEGLAHKLGALVFQISPLPSKWLGQMPKLIDRLQRCLLALPDLKITAPDGVIAVEVRDPEWLCPQFVDALRASGTTYCLGLHAKMPPIAEQLPVLRALWPGPLVCRWNLNPVHGAFGYESAQTLYSPFDKMLDPDVATRKVLARVISGTAGAGQNVFVTISNHAEGSAPFSTIELARAIVAAE